MPKLDGPLQLLPVFKPKIWGRNDLRPLFTCEPARGSPGSPAGRVDSGLGREKLIGEVWLTDDQALFVNGPLAGMTLGEAAERYGREIVGRCSNVSRFPILAKYIFTSDWLSVQVHPDDDYARVHEPGNLGKCEMWYVVHGERRAEILLGLKPGVSKQGLRGALEKSCASELLQRFRPKAGEAVFVPPGTVHAIGPGLVLFEAEQNSDLTYRLDDFGRLGLDGKPRPLHLEKGLEVIRFGAAVNRDLPRLEFREPFGSRRYVLACRFFAVEELTLRKAGSFQGSPQRVEVLSVVEGEGRVETEAGWLAFRSGDTWLIPPATRLFRLVPRKKSRLLKFYVPDLDEDFRRPLARRGVRASRIERVCFN